MLRIWLTALIFIKPKLDSPTLVEIVCTSVMSTKLISMKNAILMIAPLMRASNAVMTYFQKSITSTIFSQFRQKYFWEHLNFNMIAGTCKSDYIHSHTIYILPPHDYDISEEREKLL